MSNLCKPITIFEGPDGGGKSTAARAHAAKTGARYIHCGPFPGVKSIGRLYLEAMAPALEGYQAVVMDRCWISEGIYGLVHRGGLDRLGVASRRMLERVAMRCHAEVLLYLPPLEACLKNFRSRRGEELLDSEKKLEHVYHKYADRYVGTSIHRLTDLPVERIDYTTGGCPTRATYYPDQVMHQAAWSSAGSRSAKVLVVGERLGNRKEADGWAQYPFVSFSNLGCSQWLTQHLEDCKIMEADLLWVNADAPCLPEVLASHPCLPRVVLGDNAWNTLLPIDKHTTGMDAICVPVTHPQHAKRFGFRKTYDLIHTLKELIK
jgi:thymidylate kinase